MLTASEGMLVVTAGASGATLGPGDSVRLRIAELDVTLTVDLAPAPFTPSPDCDCSACRDVEDVTTALL